MKGLRAFHRGIARFRRIRRLGRMKAAVHAGKNGMRRAPAVVVIK